MVKLMYMLAPEADITGTSLSGELEIAPAKLVELFGEPPECDSYKVSGSYTFKDWEDNIITLYDWKCTSLYGHEDDPSPEKFWASTHPHEFHVGSVDHEAGHRFINIMRSLLLEEHQ